ncbi:MAG: alpha/beta hydrolase [Atopobiaceae bacterium]|nr:alpha/beta hydrolase [Atopobiaceae bacterium]
MSVDNATYVSPQARSLPLDTTPDLVGDRWAAPTWKQLVVTGSVAAGAVILGLGHLASRRRFGACAGLLAGVAALGVGVAHAIGRPLDSALAAPHSTALTVGERQFLEEHPTALGAESFRHAERIGRKLTGIAPDSFVSYYQAMSEEQADVIRQNRVSEEASCWEWSNGVEFQRAEVVAEDGARLMGNYCVTDPASGKWALLVHGWCDAWNEMTVYARAYAEHGFNLLIPEMRGHGESGGEIVGLGWLDRRDLVQWLRWLVDERRAEQIVAHGHSMGAASVCLMSAELDLPAELRATVCDCGFSDVLNVFAPIIRNGIPFSTDGIVGLILDLMRLAVKLRPDGFDLADASPERAAHDARVPVLLIHGMADTFIPPYMARRIFEALPADKGKLLEVPGAGHCQSVLADPELYWGTVFEFLGSAGVSTTVPLSK